MNFIVTDIIGFYHDGSISLYDFLIVLGLLVFVLIIDWLTRKGPLYFPDKDCGNLKNYTLGFSKTDPVSFDAIEGKTFGLGSKILVWLLALIICFVPISEFIWTLKEYIYPYFS